MDYAVNAQFSHFPGLNKLIKSLQHWIKIIIQCKVMLYSVKS